MKDNSVFVKNLIAPCGIYCGVCYAYLRDKNKCQGCRIDFENKPRSCVACTIANCEKLAGFESGFCYECDKMCQRMKRLDKRYRERYGTSLIGNLMYIKENGVQAFLEIEKEKRTCNDCGKIVSIHWKECKDCGNQL